MKPVFTLTLAALIAVATLMAWTATSAGSPPPQSEHPRTMKAFASEQELKDFLRELARKRRRSVRRSMVVVAGMIEAGAAPPPAVKGETLAQETESITNTQHAGVDEGDIVKLHGDHLVILRRGRLFTVAVGDGQLKPVSTVNAFGADMNPEGTWYDEMLISDDTVVIIGYSYERGGTEIGLFNINAQGQLSYRSTYHMRSNDYYSSRNYASRLIGNKLIFYTPLYWYRGDQDPANTLPAVRKWHKGATASEFRRIVPATRVYRPQADFDVEEGMAVHTVTVCDLANGGFACEGTSVIGPEGRVFYVSPDSVYVWASSSSYGDKSKPSLLFRMPLDGSEPSALRVSGSPVDQFSFLQSDDHYLNVLVRSEAKGDGMWRAEVAEGEVALMRIPISSFSDGSYIVPATSYQQLPKPEGYAFENRFVGNYLLYGTGTGWRRPETLQMPKDLFLVEWANGNTHKL